MLYDPAGLDRPELIRLARARKPVSEFSKDKLGPEGYQVLVDEQDVQLPSKFFSFPRGPTMLIRVSRGDCTRRNRFPEHVPFPRKGGSLRPLRWKVCLEAISAPLLADMARPEAVNISNVTNLVDTEGKPNFKYVVEGANLFFTQQARFWLEKKGVVLFKDSSTNKVRGPILKFWLGRYVLMDWVGSLGRSHVVLA